MRNRLKVLSIDLISAMFALLYIYAAISKLIDFQRFQVDLGKSIEKFYILPGCFLFSVVVIILLCYISNSEKQRNNHFVRLLPSDVISNESIIHLQTSGFSFYGFHHGEIYLGKRDDPEKFLKIDRSLKDSISFRVIQPEGTKLTRGYTNVVDSNLIFTLEGNQPALLEGNLANLKLKLAIKLPYFTQAIHIFDKSFILRVVQGGKNRLVGRRLDKEGLVKYSDILEKQIDGVFCTDGNIIKVPGSNKIIYVNKQSAVNERYFFIHPGLIADTEVAESLENVSIIDVHAIANGKYQFSFYLPEFRGHKVRDFKVYGKSLYALYDHYLYKYKLNF